MPFVDFLDDGCGMRDIIMNRKDRLNSFLDLVEDVMRGPSTLSIPDRELIGAFVSSINGCSFCFGAHATTAAQFGIKKELFEDLVEDIDTSDVEEKLKPLLHYVKKLTLTPSKMIQADADAVYAAGWDDKALSDAVLVCAKFNMANRMVEGHGINRALPNAYFEKASKNIASKGYKGW